LAPSYTNAGAGNFAGAFPGMWKGPGSMRIQLIRRVEQSLDLSQIQKDKIDLLTKDAEQTLRTLWTPMGAQVQRELRGLENRIDEVLTPDQKATFHDGIRRRPQDVRSPSTTNGPTGGTNLLPATNGSAAGKSS
jgi:Spy/CpxP family protein refolding chaperone